MRHAIGDLLRHLLQGSQLEPRSLLWGILIGACVLSALHLVTMFVTRWGNRRVTGKALLFSLMLHFGFSGRRRDRRAGSDVCRRAIRRAATERSAW